MKVNEKKILLASKLFEPNIGGVENSLKQIALVLNDDWDVKILTTDINNINDEILPEYQRTGNISILRVKQSKNRFISELNYHIKTFSLFRKFIGSEPKIIVLARNHYSVLQAWLAGSKNIVYLVPGVIKYQNNEANLNDGIKSYISLVVGKFLQKKAFQKANKLFVFSNNMLEQVKSTYEAKEIQPIITICKPGVNYNQFSPVSDSHKTQMKIKLNLPDGKIIILGLARFVKAKGFEQLIESMQEFPNSHCLVLVGDGPELENYKNIIKKLALSNVIIRKPTSTPEFYYQASDIFAMTSIYEPLGQTINEAQACGLPVIYYKPSENVVTASKEIIYKNYSFSANYSSNTSLISAINLATNNLNGHDSREMAAWIKSNFTWEKLVKDLFG